MTNATATATGLNISAGNAFVNGISVNNSTTSTSASVFGIGSVLSATNIVSGYNAYRNGTGLSYGLYGVSGTNALYNETNNATYAGFLQGRAVISSESSPSSALGTDLEVRNTTTGAAAPATVSLRQTTALATTGNVLANLNFGDNYVTTPQARIQVLRDAAASSAADIPTAMTFSTTSDASAALTERMRITNVGQLGIGTITPQGILDITSPTNGILVPRVSLADIITAAPVVNPQGGALVAGTLVWNTATAGTFPNNVIPGFYYWNGSIWISVTGAAANSWSLTGNGGTNGGTTVLAGTNFIGTVDNQNIDIRTNNTYRGRFSSLGEFFLGTLNTATVGDLQSAVGNATFPWAVNGYTSNSGGGVYGSITSGTSIFGAVQGEYSGTSMYGSGIVGLTYNTTSGTDFIGNTASAIYGGLGNSANRNFGVFGDTFSNVSTRTGGVLGTDGVRAGALGYYNNSSVSYAVYGFNQLYQQGSATGKMANPNYINASIGLGIYGGVIGGWIKGDEYGTVFSGKRFSSYNLGKVISNEDYIVVSGKDNKVVSYASTALQPEINSKGIAKLVSGQADVAFDKAFSQLVDKSKPIIVTCTPMGETKGVFLSKVTSEGFKIKENQNGNSNVSFSWMAIGEKDVSENQKLSVEILDKDFEDNLNGVMHDENLDGGKAIWSQNGKVQFGNKAPENPYKKREKPQRGRNKTKEKKN